MISKKRSQEIFLDLVNIYSPSGHEEKLAKYLIDFFAKLGKRARRDKIGNVIMHLPGKGEPLLVCAHLDTLPAKTAIKPIVKNGVIASDGTTILGADDKAGIAPILCAVEHLIKNNKPHRSLELVFTVNEEIDNAGAVNLNYKKLKSKQAILIDDCAKLGRITLASPFLYDLEIKVKGKSVHAGDSPEKGVNALQVASRAIAELKIGRINKYTTTNLVLVEGGKDASEVPGEIVIKGEARSLRQEMALEQIDKINKTFKKYVRRFRAKLYFKSKLFAKGYEHKKSSPLVKTLADLNTEFGLKTVYQKTVFMTDANIFNARRIEMVNISFGGFGCHTNKERISVDELQQLSEYLTVLFLL